MKQRKTFDELLPGSYSVLEPLDSLIGNSTISKQIIEMIRIRASQINGCVYCIDYHTSEAMKLGVPDQKIMLLSRWKEASSLFTRDEQIALMLTDQATLIHEQGISDFAYEKGVEVFGEKGMVEVLMAIISINAWNRIGISSKLQVISKSIIGMN